MKTLILLSLLSLPRDRADFVNWSAGIADAAQTTYNVTHGGREGWNPTQSAPGNVAMILGGKAIETAVAHRCHRKVCRAVPWIAAAGSALAVGYSARAVSPLHCTPVASSVRATYDCR